MAGVRPLLRSLVLWITATLCLGPALLPPVAAACVDPLPVSHQVSYFTCGNGLPAHLYQADTPATNSGGEDIVCEAADGVRCAGGGAADDAFVSIETDWSRAGFSGCPVTPQGAQRLVLVLRGRSTSLAGESLIVSLAPSPRDTADGYMVDMAHPFDAATGTILPLECRSSIVITGINGGDLTLRIAPVLRSDCDPGTVGEYYGSCFEGLVPVFSPGPVYYRHQIAGDPVPFPRSAWISTGILPDPSGLARVTLDAAPPGAFLLVGGTVVVDGVESDVVVHFAVADVDCTDNDGDTFLTCGGDCDDRDPAVNPAAAEVCNGRDDDCDGQVDEGFDSDGDVIGDCLDNCRFSRNPDQADTDMDGIGDVCDNCPLAANTDQADVDADWIGDRCDNCVTFVNPDQADCNWNGIGDACDECFEPEPPAPNPCGCGIQRILDVSIDFSSPYGHGSGLVFWRTTREVDIIGFNVVVFDKQGRRIQQNDALIRAEAGPPPNTGASYNFIVPKHKSGQGIYVEMLRLNGTVQVFGPAVRIQ